LEINILIVAMEIVQGSFQYIFSYNLSANLLSMKSLFNTQTFAVSGPALVTALNELAVSDTFTVRNSGAVASAKTTFIDTADHIIDSYTYITEKSSQYPDAAKEIITTPDARGVWSSLKVLQSGFNTLHTHQGAGY
jgi:hypothetical protein